MTLRFAINIGMPFSNIISISHLILLQAGIFQDLLHWTQGVLEEISVKLFETGTGQSLRKVYAIIESFNLQS